MGNMLVAVISGVAEPTGKGRQTIRANYQGPLEPFLEEWGEGNTVSPDEVDSALAALKAAAGDPAKLSQALMEAGSKLAGSKGKVTNMADAIVSAVCKWLEKEHGFAITSEDPGDGFYISPEDLTVSERKIEGDGSLYSVVEVAPFGLTV